MFTYKSKREFILRPSFEVSMKNMREEEINRTIQDQN